MKKWFFAAAALAAGTLGAGQLTSIGRTDTPPVIDGKANDTCYKNTLPITGLVYAKSLDHVKDQTELRMVYDDRYLYGAVIAKQQNAAKLPNLTPSKDKSTIWEYDSVELFFERDNSLFQYMFDYSGSSYVLRYHQNERLTWDHETFKSNLKVAAGRLNDAWILEFAIPRSELPKGDFRFNLIRNHGRNKHATWARLEEVNWRMPDKYGTVRMVKTAPGLAFKTLPQLNLKSVASLTVDSAAPLEITLDAAGKKTVRKISSGTADFNYTLPASNREVTVTVNDGSNKIYEYTYARPEGRLEIKPGNLADNTVILDSGLGMAGRIIWSSKHNLPRSESGYGLRCRIANELVFEVPEGITVLRAKEKGRRKADGKTLVTFVQKERYAYNSHGWIKTSFKSTLPGGSTGTIRYKLQWKGGVQPWQELKYKVISIKPAPRPKRFISGFYNNWIHTIAEARQLGQIGINTFPHRGYSESSIKFAHDLRKDGYFIKRGGYFWPGGVTHNGRNYKHWAADDRSARARDIAGFYIPSKDGFQISPTYRGKFYDEAIQKEIDFCKKAKISYFAFDMEGYVMAQGEKGDFCLRTLDLFKKHFTEKYPDRKYIDPKVFERDPKKYPFYHTAWVEFKCDQWADFFGEMKKRFAAGLGPDCKSSPYDGVYFTEWSLRRPWTEEGRNQCLRNGNFFKVFGAMELDIYTSMDRGIRETNEKLDNFAKTFPGQKLNFILTPCPHALLKGHYRSVAPHFPEEFKFCIMETFTWGCVGVIPWHFGLADLESLRQFSEAMNMLAKVEDIVLDGKPAKVSNDLPKIKVTDFFYGKKATWENQPQLFVRGRELNGRTLISVSEYLTGKQMTVKVDFAPGRKVAATDLATGEKLFTMAASDRSFKIDLDPQTRCRLLLFEPVK